MGEKQEDWGKQKVSTQNNGVVFAAARWSRLIPWRRLPEVVGFLLGEV